MEELGTPEVKGEFSDHSALERAFIAILYVCKVICLKAGLSLDMHYQGSVYLSLLDKRKE